MDPTVQHMFYNNNTDKMITFEKVCFHSFANLRTHTFWKVLIFIVLVQILLVTIRENYGEFKMNMYKESGWQSPPPTIQLVQIMQLQEHSI